MPVLIMPMLRPFPRVFLSPLIGQNQSIFHTTTALQHVRIVGGVIPFADYFGGAEFEFFGKRGRACPLDVFFVVVCACVFAAHDIYFVEALGGAANAFQLRVVSGGVRVSL
jgi:hypothetical protein